MSDLIVVEKKLNKIKVAIVALIVLLIIILIIVVITNINKKEKTLAKNNEEEIMQIGSKDNPVIITEKNEGKLPNLTNVGRELIDNIYAADGHTAYLTFDDGPSETVTPLILDLLKERNIKATFFVLGSRAELYPEIVKRAYKEGHYIANHGYSHVYSNIYQSVDTILEEYEQTEAAIKSALDLSNYNSHLFRFPGGSVGGRYSSVKREAIDVLDENGVMYMDWNALTNDAAGSDTAEEIMESLISTVGEKENVVILMHDASDKILTYECLPDIIDFLIEKGYTFDNFYNIIK